MMSAEETESLLKSSRAELADVTAVWEDDHRQLLDEKAALEKEVAQMLDKRRTMLGSIPADDLKVYEGLKPKKGGRPVAILNESACSLCGVDQNMAVEREVRQGQKLVYCGNCGRILVNKI
jgi:predicted  nucleic acid-binding Zn-ribbon protein